MSLYNYKITDIVKIVDGDTVYVNVSLGFDIKALVKVRLAEVDTPELNSKDEEERIKAKEYKQYVQTVLQSAPGELILHTKHRGKYGRWIGDILWEDNGLNLSLVGHIKVKMEEDGLL